MLHSFSQKPHHRPDHSRHLHRKKACWNYGELFLMQARNSSPFRPEALPRCSQKIWTACLWHQRFRSLPYLQGDSSRYASVSPPSPALPQGMCKRIHDHPVHMLRSCCGQVHSLLPFLPERSPALLKESPLPQYHTSHLKFSAHSVLPHPFWNHPEALQEVCCRSGYPASHPQ